MTTILAFLSIFPSPYKGEYTGMIGLARPSFIQASIRGDGLVTAKIDGKTTYGFIGKRFILSYINAPFRYDGKTIKDVGVQPFFILMKRK